MAKVITNLWHGPRLLRLGPQLHLMVAYPRCGLPAGSGWNDAMVQAYAIVAFDSWALRHPKATLASMIDDDTIAAHGTEG